MSSQSAIELKDDLDPQQFATLAEMFDASLAAHADRPAFTCMGETLSYRELDHCSRKFADYLRKRPDLQPGDRIALQLPNILQFPVAFIGATRAGLVPVNTNPLYTAREMKHQFQDSGVKAVVILANFGDKLQQILKDTQISTVITTELGDMLPGLRRLLVNAAVRYVKKMVPSYDIPQAIRWKQCMGGEATPGNTPSGTDVAILLYTGGTTGLAKGAMLTHSNLIHNMMQLRAVSKTRIRDEQDTIVAPLPLYHTYAFMFHCMTMVYAGNHNVLIPNPRDIDDLVKTLSSLTINGFIGINTLYLALARHPKIDQVDFSQMNFSGSGGMALTVNVAKQWAKLTNCEVYEGYGLTECSPVVTVNPTGNIKLGTVGQAVPMTELKLVDDEGRDVTDGGTGELWVRGPQVMKGYWRNEAATREALTQDGWFKTGDYAQIDAEGFVKIVDRKKDMIIVSGFNVFPSEIEEVVNAHPGVLESAAIGVPSEKTGEGVKLFVVRSDASLSEADIKAYCRENLTAYKIPFQIEFAEDLPKSNVGKILRRELREQQSAKPPA